MRVTLKFLGSMAGAGALLLTLAATSWACAPQMGITPNSGPPGGWTQVDGEYFADGSLVALHWNSARGPILGMVTGPVFLISVRIPADANPGVYWIVAIDHGTGSVIVSDHFRVSVPAAAPVATQPSGVSKSVSARAAAPKSIPTSAVAQPRARASVATASMADPVAATNSISPSTHAAAPLVPLQLREDSRATSGRLTKDVVPTAIRPVQTAGALNVKDAGAGAAGLVFVLGLAVALRRRLRPKLEDPPTAKVIPLVRAGLKPPASGPMKDRDRLSA